MFRSTAPAEPTTAVDPRRLAWLGARIAEEGAAAHEAELATLVAHARAVIGSHVAIDVLADRTEPAVVRARAFDRVAGLVVAAGPSTRPRRAVSRSRRRPPARSAASHPAVQAALSSRPAIR